MSDRTKGWAFVAMQAVLIGILIVLPGRDDFAIPGWLRTSIDIVFWTGAVLAIVAGLSLGRALTATPVPNAGGELRTNGLYRFARHPIYAGVILIVVSMTVRSRSLISVAVGVATLGFFVVKTNWEERRLTARYSGYAEYAARTARFVPSPFGNHR